MSLVNEDNWVKRLKADEGVRDRAIQELGVILERGLRAASRNRYGNKIPVDDVVQEALIKILEKLDTFEGRSKFTTWAMTVATRLAISSIRRKHFKDVSINALTKDGLTFDPAVTDAPVEDHDGMSELLAKLRELIDTVLSPKQRDAVHSLLNGMPVEVIAEKTGSNRNAVYKLVHDARTKLRNGFEQAGFRTEDINSVFA